VLDSNSDPDGDGSSVSPADGDGSLTSAASTQNLVDSFFFLGSFGVIRPRRIIGDLTLFSYPISVSWTASWQFVQSLPFGQPRGAKKKGHG